MFIESLEDRIAPAALVVTTLADSGDGSLRAALSAAQNPQAGIDEIDFASNLHGKIVLKSALPAIMESIAIEGPDRGITIDGANAYQIFSVTHTALDEAVDVTFANLTLTHGRAAQGGAVSIHDTDGSIHFIGTDFIANEATTDSGTAQGGALNIAAGTVTVSDSKLTSNKAVAVNGNAAAHGGFAYLGTDAYLFINSSTGTGNSAVGGTSSIVEAPSEAAGGAIYSDGHLTVQDSKLTGDFVKGGLGAAEGAGGAAEGGSLYISGLGNASVSFTTISHAKATGGAGGASKVTGHAGGLGGAAHGGAIDVASEGRLNIESSTISASTATGGAGGKGGPQADGGASGDGIGGAVHISDLASLTATSSTFSSDKAVPGAAGAAGATVAHVHGDKGASGAALGGAIAAGAAQFTAKQITVAKNAAGQGGGVYAAGGDQVKIDNSTIAFNSATVGGGGLYMADPAHFVIVASTVIAKNTSHQEASTDVHGNLFLDYSFIGKSAGTTVGGGSEFYTLDRDPLLGLLANNGGGLQTILPKKNSPLIDVGSNPDNEGTDERGGGYLRIVGGGVDIGAVEFGAKPAGVS